MSELVDLAFCKGRTVIHQTKTIVLCFGLIWVAVGFNSFELTCVTAQDLQSKELPSSAGQNDHAAINPSSDSISEGQEIMIVTDNASVRDEGTQRALLRCGTITVAGPMRDSWIWLPSYRGYVQRDQVIPVEQGEAFLNKLLADEPTALNFAARGYFHEHQKQFESALRDYEEAVKLQPTFWMAITSRAKVQEALGRIDLAGSDFDWVVKKSDRPAWALMERGQFLIRTRKYELAIQDFEKAHQLWTRGLKAANSQNRDYLLSRQADSLSDLAWCNFRLNRHEIALEKIEAAMEISPDDWFIRGRRRTILRKLGRHQDVQNELEAELAKPDVSAVTLNEFSYFLATCQEPTFRDGKRAVELALKCCALRKEDPAFLDTLACAWAETGNFENAMEVQTHAISLLDQADPELPEFRARLELFRQGKAYRE